MEQLSKSQFILLVLLISFVVSAVTAILTAALIDQAPQPVTQTINRVIERVSGGKDDALIPEEDRTAVRRYNEEIVNIVERVAPAVLSVVATKDIPLITECAINPFANDDVFSQLFPGFRVPQLCQNGTEKRQVSAGSGFFVSSDGLIATNRHVVEDADAEYSVIFSNGKQLTTRVVSRDPLNDLAILKVDGNDYPALPLGDANTLKVGSTVIAVGNALGEFQNTVSVGVISGLHRTISAQSSSGVEELRSLIQTDAAINPGNSGGPLITLDGKVIGINTAVAQGAQNIGFALPVNVLRRALSGVSQSGHITYPYLGVRYVIVTPQIASAQKIGIDYGAFLMADRGEPAVIPNSPAASIGLKAGDVILELNGKRITKDEPLSPLLQELKPGDTISLKVRKTSGEEVTLQVRLGTYQE